MNLLLGYTLLSVGLILILLVTVRNRYVPMISLAFALVTVEGLLLTLIKLRTRMETPYLVASTIGLIFVDVIILLSIWPFISGNPNQEGDESQEVDPFKNKIGPFSFLVGWLLYASSIIGTIITSRWFKPILFLILIFLCINYVRSCVRTFPDG